MKLQAANMRGQISSGVSLREACLENIAADNICAGCENMSDVAVTTRLLAR
jgi:hypothetical protein